MKRACILAILVAASALAQNDGRLEPARTTRGELVRGEPRSYSIQLAADQFLHFELKSTGSDIIVALAAPKGELLLEVNTVDYAAKTAPVYFIARVAGEYRVTLSAAPGPKPISTSYEIRTDRLRGASAKDRLRADAARLLSDAQAEAEKYAYQEAIAHYQSALASYRQAADRRGEVATLLNLGLACHAFEQNDQAVSYYGQALVIALKTKDRRGQGRILANLANAYLRLGQKDQALASYERGLAIFREIGDRQRQVITLFNIAAVHSAMSQFEEALGSTKDVLAMTRELGNTALEGSALNAIGWDYYNLNQSREAAPYLEQALGIFKKIGDPVNLALTLLNLGVVRQSQGQYPAAINCYDQALVIARESKNRRNEAIALQDLGWAYDSLGQPERSIPYYEQALVIQREIKNRQGEGDVLMDLGGGYFDVGQHEKAIAYESQSLAIQRETGHRPYERITLLILGGFQIELGQPEKAIGYLEQALSIDRELGGRGGEVINNLGKAYRKSNRLTEAVSYHQKALAISRETSDREVEGTSMAELMEDWKASGRPLLAIFYGKQAVNSIQSARSDVRDLPRELQRSFLKKREEPYHTLAGLLIEQGRLGEAEQVLGLLKEEEFFKYVRGAAEETSSLNSRPDLNPDEAEWEKHWHDVGDRLMKIGVEHAGLLNKKVRTAEETRRLTSLENDLIAGNQAFEKFLGDLTLHFSAKPATGLQVSELRELQGVMTDLRELPAGTVAIYTVIGDDKLYTILRTPDAQKGYTFPIKAADLNRKIAEFREAVMDAKLDPHPAGEELYKILVGNMAEDLKQAGARTLMWSLDGVLRYVPIAALWDGTHYLIEQYRVSVITLASNARLKDHPDQEWRAAGFGVTKGFGDAGPLPEVASELTAIHAIMHGEIMLDDQFTEVSMRETLQKRYSVVHIASHFRFQPGDESKSFLLLGDGAHLSLADLRNLPNLFEGVQLLTLSACNTALGDGSEVESFGTLAQRQGAKAVVASLWQVADSSTSRMMQEFYRIRESSSGITKLEALREAQLELLRGVAKDGSPYAHPYYWAPFFLMGNWL